MRELATQSPLLLCLVVVLFGAAASLLPVSPVEPVLVGVAAVAPTWLLLPLVFLATVSHMATKTLVFAGGARAGRAISGRARERFDRAQFRLSANPRLQQSTLFVSSVTGLPPFYLVTALCGTLRMPMRQFLVVASAGRAIRFGALIFLPQLFRPTEASAQSVGAAASTVVASPVLNTAADPGHRETYVLISGMVGGEAGFRRLEKELAAPGRRIVIIDPYAISIDSADVSFDAMARRVEAMLERQDIRSARVIGHSHGGGVALRLAARSRRVSHLYLLDVGAMPDNRGKVFGASLRLIPVIMRIPGGRSFISSRFMAGLRENSVETSWLDDRTKHSYVSPILDNIDRVIAMARRLAVAAEPEPVDSVAARIVVPVTVILGTLTTAAGPTKQEFAALRQVRGPLRIDTVAGAGHFPHEEAPRGVARIIERRPQLVAARPEGGR